MGLKEEIAAMQFNGSSIVLNWGDDNNLWEVSWITGGERFCGFSTDLLTAIKEAVSKAELRFRKL